MSRRVGNLSHLECSECRQTYEVALRNLCPKCGKPLLARYDLDRVRREDLLERSDLWRYLPLLPAASPDDALTLGEGGTPLLRCGNLEKAVGVREL
mgnify:FL=1